MTALDAYQQRMWRASLSRDSLLTLDEVVEALPGPTSVVEAWTRDNVEPAGHIGEVRLYRWGDVVDTLAGGAEPPDRGRAKPITTWKGVAEVLGISDETVSRHRRDHQDRTTQPWFPDAAAVQDWWAKMHAPPPLRRTSRG